MIAQAGALMHSDNYVHPSLADYTQRYRTDDVEVTWRRDEPMESS